jgi:hypothetical protein
MIITRYAFLIIIPMFVLAAGGIFLASRTVPAPQHAIEKEISNGRFFK